MFGLRVINLKGDTKGSGKGHEGSSRKDNNLNAQVIIN